MKINELSTKLKYLGTVLLSHKYNTDKLNTSCLYTGHVYLIQKVNFWKYYKIKLYEIWLDIKFIFINPHPTNIKDEFNVINEKLYVIDITVNKITPTRRYSGYIINEEYFVMYKDWFDSQLNEYKRRKGF